MKNQRRWIKSAIDTATKEAPSLPWQRGARRALSVSRRQAQSLKAKSA